jgi:hypothetical protein
VAVAGLQRLDVDGHAGAVRALEEQRRA